MQVRRTPHSPLRNEQRGDHERPQNGIPLKEAEPQGSQAGYDEGSAGTTQRSEARGHHARGVGTRDEGSGAQAPREERTVFDVSGKIVAA